MRVRERAAERLEDRGQHVLRVLALDQADVDGQTGGVRRAPRGTLQRDRCAARLRASTSDRRSRRRAAGRTPRRRPSRAPRPGAMPNPRPASSAASSGAGPRRELSRRGRPPPPARRARSRAEPEAAGAGELLEEVVEDGDARSRSGSRRPAGSMRAAPAVVTARSRSIDAPRSRRRSSIRSYPRSI